MSAMHMNAKGIIQACPACGQKNSIGFQHLGKTGQCGRCKADLSPPAAPVEVSSQSDFQRLIETSPLPVVVDFWASWCGPCLRVAPELEKVAAGNAGQFLVVKVNTETLPALSEAYQVRSIPTMAVLVAGKEVNRTMGAQPAAAIEAFVRESLRSRNPQ
jgi:thioredoxin 2